MHGLKMGQGGGAEFLSISRKQSFSNVSLSSNVKLADLYLQIPNGFGCGLGTMQLILYFIYCNNKGPGETTKPTANGTVEMGPKIPHQEKQANGKVPQDGQV